MKNLLYSRVLLVTILLISATAGSFGQPFIPVPVTGFNHDVVAETGTSSLTTTTVTIDGSTIANHVMYTVGFGTANSLGGGGIPDNGTFTDAAGSYQMVDYASNNALLLQRTETGNLMLTTPARFNRIRIMALSTEGQSDVTVNLFFTDGTNTSTNASIGDWFFNTSNLVLSGIGRCDRATPVTSADGLPDNPRIYYIEINLACADKEKILDHINFTNVTTMGSNAPYPNAVFFAVSGTSFTPVSVSSLVNQATCSAGGNVALTLTGSAAPYSVSWNTTPVQAGLNATNLQPGSYIATITDANNCTTPYPVTIAGVTNTVPTFDPVAPVCNGSAAPSLPTTSTNGITGAWSPATVSNTASGTYTFTPDAGQCAMNTTLSVTVTTLVTPTFNPVPAFCNGSAAPVLPATSTNAITGTWNPATVSNTSSGSYTFTPDAGQCAASATISITVNAPVAPTFTALPPICNGDAAPALPATSSNGIAGTWNPATINNTASGSYTFTPNTGQCASSANLLFTVTPVLTPTFNLPTDLCIGSAAPTLPATSINGITGTWSPATVSNSTTGTYLFVPNGGAPCVTSTSVTINVSSSITPTFTALGTICDGSTAPALPATSLNGITGTWSPATVSNTASGSYVFTPSTGQCAGPATLSVTVSSPTTPTFTPIAAFCSGTTAPVLPTISLNGITGTWNPSIINNTASAVYNFTPASTQCASTTSLSVNILTGSSSITPIDICASQLPYTWNGNTYAAAGTYTVTLTNSNGCDSLATIVLSLDNITSTTNETICSAQLPYSWNGNSYTAAGSYNILLTSSGGCDSLAVLELSVIPDLLAPIVNSPVNYCLNETTLPLTATVTSPGNEFIWYVNATGGTGSTTPPTPSSSNIGNTDYYVSQVNGACEGPRILITVSVNSKPDLGTDKVFTLCNGQVKDLTTLYNTAGYTSTWTVNQSTVLNPAAANTSGIYQLVISTSACADTALVNLTILPPVHANAGPNADIEYNVPYQLSGSGGVQYEWSPALPLNNPFIANPMATLGNDQTFLLTVKDMIGCSGWDSVKLSVFKGPAYYIPTAFTPNGDGLNDFFLPTYVGIKKLLFFRVYDRYGEVIFQTQEQSKGWDGTIKGTKVNAGNYAWVLQGEDRLGVIKILKGNIVLIR